MSRTVCYSSGSNFPDAFAVIAMEPLQKLFSSLIDYAGLFPPAGLDMPVVADNYAQYMQNAHSWMLARLVVPLARLDEFESAWSGPDGLNTRISLLTPPLDAPEFFDAVNRIAEFNNQVTPHTIDAIEVRVTDPAAVSNALKLPAGVACFVEVPADNMRAVVDAIAQLNQPTRVFAKVRTGGVKPEMIPVAAYVAEFMCACAKAGIGFKATAGLHHPFRAEYPLTYEAGCDVGRMHGFINVFLGACLLNANGLSAVELTEFLDTACPDDLEITPETIAWREHKIDANAIADAREKFIISFGSCSFAEPIEDLTSLSLLPENPNATD